MPTGSGLRPRTACSRSGSPTSLTRTSSSAATARSSGSSSGARTGSVSPGAAASAPVSTWRSAGPSTRLPRCPVAYTRDDEVAYAVGNKVLVGDRPVFTADGGITYAKFGFDGSLAVVVDGKRIERWDGSSLTTTKLTPSFQGITPIFGNDNCAALFPFRQAVQLLDLGCKPGLTNLSFAGTPPPGPRTGWVATSNGVEIEFHRVVGSRREITWPVGAAALAWRPDLGSSAIRGRTHPVSSGR